MRRLVVVLVVGVAVGAGGCMSAIVGTMLVTKVVACQAKNVLPCVHDCVTDFTTWECRCPGDRP